MVKRTEKLLPALIAAIALLAGTTSAQQASKPLTNDDVLAMVNKKMPESVVISAINNSPGKYDTSAQELIRLNGAGVTEGELNAMIAVAHRAAPETQPGASASAYVPSDPNSRMPRVLVVMGNSTRELKLEKTQLTQTKTKPSSMRSLAADSTVTHAMQAGISTASWDAATHMNSYAGAVGVEEAGGIFSSALSRRNPTVTYVWGVPAPKSSNAFQTTKPNFTVDFSRTPGVHPDEYQPEIVKLTPAQNSCRIVGATQGKANASASPAADWEVFSHYLEEPVPLSLQKVAPGKYTVAVASELLPGEYGLVIRPVSKDKKFSGGEVARAQGDGLMFDAIWTFQIADDAH
jgi:hypothetical protein